MNIDLPIWGTYPSSLLDELSFPEASFIRSRFLDSFALLSPIAYTQRDIVS